MALAFLAVGLCLLLSPGTYFGLLDRMARVDLWAKPSSSWDPKAPRWRAAGVALTLFALFLIVGPPLSVYLRSPEEFNKRLYSSHHTQRHAYKLRIFGGLLFLISLLGMWVQLLRHFRR